MKLELIVDGKLYMHKRIKEHEVEYWVQQYKLIGFEESKNSWEVILVAQSKMN